MKAIPLLEFDDQKAVIEPTEQIPKLDTMPEKVVLTFFSDVVERLYNDFKITKIYELQSEMGRHTVYKFKEDNVALFALGVGGPLAAGLFEELIALGGKQFMCCGGVGMLVKKDLGCLIVPNEAVRDEGLSFHYLEPSRTVKMNKQTLEKVRSILNELHVDYIIGKTWTTDAFYRETRQKINSRLYEGCLTVEMECASLLAVAKFRKVEFAEIFYSGDDLSQEVFDGREWREQPLLRRDLIDLCKKVVKKM